MDKFPSALQLVDALHALLPHLGKRKLSASCTSVAIALRLVEKEKSFSCTELAGFARVSTAAITGIVDRLENAGLVARGKALDRRKVMVMATPLLKKLLGSDA